MSERVTSGEAVPTPGADADELTRLRRELATARAEQAATASILRAIASSPGDSQAVLQSIVDEASRLCETNNVGIFRVDGEELERVATSSRTTASIPVGGRFPIVRDTASGRAVLERRTLHHPNLQDIIEDEYPIGARIERDRVAQLGSDMSLPRSMLVIPLLREGRAIGTLTVERYEVRPFAESEISLLEAFADQAVIAIENARLFSELEQRNIDLTESLEQQTATAEILRVIASSPTDAQPVLDAIVQSAAQLAGSERSGLCLREGEDLRVVAGVGEERGAYRRGAVVQISYGRQTGRALLERRTIYTPDRSAPAALAEFPDMRIRQADASLAVPLIHEGESIGVLVLHHDRTDSFSPRLIRLIETFADQAAIAIENARLFQELQERTAELTQTLEQQTALGEVLRVIASSPTDRNTVLEAIASAAGRLTESEGAGIQVESGGFLHAVVAYGITGQRAHARANAPIMEGRYAGQPPGAPLTRGSISGRTFLERQTIHVPDVVAAIESEFPDSREGHRTLGQRSQLSTPLLREGQPIGVLVVHRFTLRPFTEQQITLLEAFADQAVIAIENARLFQELQERTADLTRTLEQQTVTAEVLRVIASSPTDSRAVLDAIAESAVQLCSADRAGLFVLEGDGMRVMAQAGGRHFPLAIDAVMPISRGSVAGRAVVDRATVHISDNLDLPVTEYPDVPTPRQPGARLALPLMREGVPIGSMIVIKHEPGLFSDPQVALLETFADQAVIAIENARLFEELQDRTAQLTRSVEELRALGEVSQAVSSSLDLQEVLTTIVSHATRLADADGGTIYQLDDAGQEFILRASYLMPDELLLAIQSAPPRPNDATIVGQAARLRSAQQQTDIEGRIADEDSPVGDALRRSGYRALVAVPLIRDERTVGMLVIRRKTPGEFSEPVIRMLTLLASQSQLAIENALLFQQVEEKGRELEVASQHKSDFLANMSHELRTPLNAIIGYSEMLQEEAEDLDAEAFLPDLRRINAAGKHLLGLINDILDLSKIEAGRMDLHLEQFDVAELIGDVASIVKPLVEKNGNTLIVSCPDEVGEMEADLTKVRQTLFNLLSNAAKFTDHGTITLRVAREAPSLRPPPPAAGEGEMAGLRPSPAHGGGVGGRGFVTFAVSDTGIGMTEEQLGRLFEAFSQADPSTTRRYGGTGLGLAISKHFCQIMGGDIAVESAPGRGSTFTVVLPAAGTRDEGRETRAGAPDSPLVPHPSPLAPGPVVLVIDDDPATRDLLGRYLQAEGFHVVTAANGEEGLRLARERRPVAITLDVLMPGVDGWSVLTTLKADPDLADIPVVVVSILDDRGLGYALGATDYLTKPIDRERLLTILRRYRPAGPTAPVLVVDDDPAARDMLRRTLEREGWAVEEAPDGRVGLAQVAARMPALILLDLMMPEMDGFDFVDELRRNEAWRELPVVVVTAKQLTEEERRRLNGHVERVIQKGRQSRHDLLAEIRDLVAQVRRQRRPPG